MVEEKETRRGLRVSHGGQKRLPLNDILGTPGLISTTFRYSIYSTQIHKTLHQTEHVRRSICRQNSKTGPKGQLSGVQAYYDSGRAHFEIHGFAIIETGPNPHARNQEQGTVLRHSATSGTNNCASSLGKCGLVHERAPTMIEWYKIEVLPTGCTLFPPQASTSQFIAVQQQFSVFEPSTRFSSRPVL